MLRIPGFDLARAYAIFGMFIVNFNFSFGNLADDSPAGNFLNIFVGNSTSVFIILAGMGVSFMTSRKAYAEGEKKRLRSVVLKRSWFLLALGLLLYSWWPGDILHFYGGYMHVAALILFVPKRYYILSAVNVIIVYHMLLLLIPIDTGWNFYTFEYPDFWTLSGFLRNTLYNGWNSIFPWIAYFFVGMWLGRLNWNDQRIRKNIFLTGLICFVVFEVFRLIVEQGSFSPFMKDYVLSEYFPPYPTYLIITTSYALMVITICTFIAEKFSGSRLIGWLATTGRMTLSNYIIHITLGMILFAWLSGKHYSGLLEDETPTPPMHIMGFAFAFFCLCVAFNVLWNKRFKHGPIESLMRKISG